MATRLDHLHQEYGAELAPDGIPLRYADIEAEYAAALNDAVLLDRSHEGRLKIGGVDRFEFLNRMSTNHMLDMTSGEGRATIFTNANARIIQRIIAYNLPDYLLVITEPGQAKFLEQFLKKQIFFNDKVTIDNITSQTNQFAVHGPLADAIMQALRVELPELTAAEITIKDCETIVGQNKPLHRSYWFVIASNEDAEAVYQAIISTGEVHGLRPAGSLTYNALRIRSGRPAGRELSEDYIPLEVGLFDEISFNKGCYTGQEIIARMESRAQLARVLVQLKLEAFVEAPADIEYAGRVVGRLTSSFIAPDQSVVALGVIKTNSTKLGDSVLINGVQTIIEEYAGQHPPYLETIQAAE